MSNCLILNGSGAVAVALTRDLCQSGYRVYLSASQYALGTLLELDLTNPELKSKYEIIPFSETMGQLATLKASIPHSVEFIVSLNRTTGETGVTLDDLDIIKALGESGIMDEVTNVLVGLQTDRRIPDDMVFALEDEVIEMAPSLTCHSITTDFNDLFKTEEDIMETKVVSNLRRSSLKGKDIVTYYDLFKLVLYYLLPDFLMSLLT